MDNKNGFYTIVAPATMQAGMDYTVTLTIHKIKEPVTINIGITGPSYTDSRTIEIQPFSSEIVNFKIPDILEEGKYELQTEGIAGLIFRKSESLDVAFNKPQVYIQTDKAMYKPGDLVQYRILALDENLKPAKLSEPLNFGILDGAGNQIKYVKGIEFTKGVHSGKFQLSEQPVLGNWYIDVTEGAENKDKTKKQFEVAKYVLPKFTVEIETDKEVAILDKVVKILLRSKYTYGKPVKGKATVTLTNKSHFSNKPVEAVEKTLDINGKGQVEFDLMDDLNFENYLDQYMPEFNVEATMTEAITDLIQTTSTTIKVKRSRFNITVPNVEREYEVNKPFEIKAVIKRLNGLPVSNAKSTAKLMISQNNRGGARPCFGGGIGFGISVYGGMNNDLIYEADINEHGIAVFKLKLTKEGDYSNVRVMYEEEVQHCTSFRMVKELGKDKPSDGLFSPSSSKPLQIRSLSKMFNLGEEFTLNVQSQKPLSYLVYTIKARGRIIQHKYIHVDSDNKCQYQLHLKATFDMMPKAKIFVYSIDTDGELLFDETTIDICNTFENKLEIAAPEQAKASDIVTLNIKSDPDSFVGLLGVDQSVLILQSGNDLDKNHIIDDLNCYETSSRSGDYFVYRPWHSPGVSSGLVTLTNASVPQPPPPMYACGSIMPEQAMLFGGPPAVAFAAPAMMQCQSMPMSDTIALNSACAIVEPPKIRKDFVENWIFDNIKSTDSNGMATFSKKIPDTITSWVITGFSINDQTGFCMTDDATKIRVFQPFFLSTNLPYSIKRGEVITIPVVVFNYMEYDLETEVTMENVEDEYEFMETSYGTELKKKITVSSNSAETVSFTIKPKIVGDLMLKIKAITPVAGDAMHQKLKVEPEGVTQYENMCHFITIPNGLSVEHNLKANIPKDVVLDSEYLEFMVVGDILGPTIKNIDKLVRMPYGCGEQNMINFVPNILVLEYLIAIGREMPSLAEKAKNYMETGFQRELTYKHKNGSYSAFGEGSSESNSWLTAYVARSFIQARKFITIDNKIIEDALEYLIQTQKDNGQFPQTGRLFHSSNQNELGVSAFILLAFLEDKDYIKKYKQQVDKCVEYLASNVENEDNIYSLALVLLVFQKAEHPLAASVKEKLQSKAQQGSSLKWWSNALKYNNNDIEVTAYILQSLLETEEPGELLPIIKWLIGQRNNLGGFDSTQDTVVGLKALVAFAEKYAATGNGEVMIKFKAQDETGVETTSGNISVDKENSLILQSHLLPKSTRQVCLTGEGEGSALVQLSYHYNINTQKSKPSFVIEHTLKSSQISNQLSMSVVAEYKPQSDDITHSNMVVMEIALPSGYTTHNDNIEPIRRVAQVQRVETKNDDTVIVIYFEQLVAGEPISVEISADKSHAVDKLKPAPITIYDYYNTNERTTVYYDINTEIV
ncbi:CD109 antigen-like [Musca autumnalis]|uniref:CD109 antigen-like n=1 Tax=Musca autumnalis TaxID=221902 RepID=UPI003CE69E3F